MTDDVVNPRRPGDDKPGRATTPKLTVDTACHICGKSALKLVPGYERFSIVTSDCKPWPGGGRLGVCQACGCVQKVVDPAWQSGIEKIYQAYSIYYQSDGAEQPVFDEISGLTSPRSGRLLKRLHSHLHLPETGRLLDIGCGNGALLRSFNHLLPRWSLAGAEINDKYRQQVEGINGVEAFYTCPPDWIRGTFNIITLIHVLEHVLGPREFLKSLQDRLADDGLLVVEVPEYLQNPFDLLIVDHGTHFTKTTATQLIEKAGYETVIATTDWIPKELTLVACKAKSKRMDRVEPAPALSFESPARCLDWLESVKDAARKIATRGNFGLFGTSISATWLFHELREVVDFFVDEDPDRAGKQYMNLPVYHPAKVPAGSQVYIVLPPKLARGIKKRLEGLKYSFKCYLTPPLGW